MDDVWETFYFGDKSHNGMGDDDGDGLIDLEEYRNDTNPNNADTDGDNISDGYEVYTGTDPTDALDAPNLPMSAGLWNTHEPDGSLKTYIDITIGQNFTGTLPGDIEITVTGPSGLVASYPEDDFTYNDQFRDFFIAIDGAPEIGEYTITVTSGSLTGTCSDSQSVIRTIPVPDISTFSPPEGTTVTSTTPTFSWGPVDYTESPIYYRFVISDLNGNWIFFTSRTEGMLFFTLPEGTLQSNTTYQYRVECHDSPNFNSLENRSQSYWVSFTTAVTLSHDAIPAFDPNSWNAVTFSWSGQTGGLLCSVKVIDHDGVYYDRYSETSSHTVTVSGGGLTDEPLYFDSLISSTSAYYGAYLGGS